MPNLTPEERPVKLGCIASAVLESIVALDEAPESEIADEVVPADRLAGSATLK